MAGLFSIWYRNVQQRLVVKIVSFQFEKCQSLIRLLIGNVCIL